MLPTPSTSHVNYDHIYEPAEDSHLLLDTLSSATETAFLRSRFSPAAAQSASIPAPLVLEVGTGSGVVLAFVTAHANRLFGRADVATLGVDMNALACAATRMTVKAAVAGAAAAAVSRAACAGAFADVIVGDLAASIRPGAVDVLIFNPPYVPSEMLPAAPTVIEAAEGERQALTSDERFARDSNLLALSTDGGRDGMEVTNRLLDQLDDVLSPRGVAYVLLCAQNKPDEVEARIRSWTTGGRGGGGGGGTGGSWSAEKVGSSGKKAGWERLCVMRILRR